jgi:spoIIIJ-associated protein
MQMKKEEKILQQLADELLSLMSVKGTASVSYNKENEAFNVDIEAEDATGLLIGKKGETLSSLQVILGILFKQKVGEWNNVIVNVGDYREKEEDYLKNLATSAAERAKETGESQNLYNLKPWQRRVIHLVLKEDTDIVTESEGEEPERYLVIKSNK